MNDWNRSHPFARLNWGIIVFCYIAWWPAGLVLTFLKLFDEKALKADEQAKRDWVAHINGDIHAAAPMPQAAPSSGSTVPYSNPVYTAPPYTAKRPYTAAAPVFTAADATARINTNQQKSHQFQQTAIIVLAVLSAVFIVIGIPDLARVLDWAMYIGLDRYMITAYLLPGLAKVIGGIGLGFFASHMRIGARREKLLATIVGPRDSVTVQELCAASGFSEKKTMQYLQDGIGHGLFGTTAYLDRAAKTLVVRGAAPAAPKKAFAKAKKEDAAPAPDENKYQATLRQLRELNDAIPGEEMSAKIDELEQLSARIFALAEKDPKKVPQLNRFMDYYLPTALKLLSTYATLDSQGMTGQNIDETKASIENAMDMLIKAFAAQLDKLFESDALDVSSDIAALKGMLSMDGLDDSKDFIAQHEPKDNEL